MPGEVVLGRSCVFPAETQERIAVWSLFALQVHQINKKKVQSVTDQGEKVGCKQCNEY